MCAMQKKVYNVGSQDENDKLVLGRMREANLMALNLSSECCCLASLRHHYQVDIWTALVSIICIHCLPLP